MAAHAAQAALRHVEFLYTHAIQTATQIVRLETTNVAQAAQAAQAATKIARLEEKNRTQAAQATEAAKQIATLKRNIESLAAESINQSERESSSSSLVRFTTFSLCYFLSHLLTASLSLSL